MKRGMACADPFLIIHKNNENVFNTVGAVRLGYVGFDWISVCTGIPGKGEKKRYGRSTKVPCENTPTVDKRLTNRLVNITILK